MLTQPKCQVSKCVNVPTLKLERDSLENDTQQQELPVTELANKLWELSPDAFNLTTISISKCE